MTRRITKKYAQWLRPPRVRGPLTAAEAARALPRLLQRLRSRNEAWIIVATEGTGPQAVVLSARYVQAQLTAR